MCIVATDLATLSFALYRPVHELETWTCSDCSATLEVVDVHQSKLAGLGIVAVNHAEEYILGAFRGTTSWLNVVSDLDDDFYEYRGEPDVLVHRGIYELYVGLAPDMVGTVVDTHAQFPGYTIVLTGHSLGGALSTHLALELWEQQLLQSTVYTFGSPRVGNMQFAQRFSDGLGDSTFRVTHALDMVPHLPLKVLGFRHVQTEVHQDTDGHFHWCAQPEDKTCANQYSAMALRMADHSTYMGVTHAHSI